MMGGYVIKNNSPFLSLLSSTILCDSSVIFQVGAPMMGGPMMPGAYGVVISFLLFHVSVNLFLSDFV